MTPQIKKTGLPVALCLTLFLCLSVQQLTAQNNARNGAKPPATLTGLQSLQQKKLKTSEIISTPPPVRPRQHGAQKQPLENRYTFTGNGSWYAQSNWESNRVPPVSLQPGDHIVIDGSGPCLLSNTQAISFAAGTTLEIKAGKQLYVSLANRFVFRGGSLVNNGKLNVLSGTFSTKNAQTPAAAQTGTVKTTRLSKIDLQKKQD